MLYFLQHFLQTDLFALRPRLIFMVLCMSKANLGLMALQQKHRGNKSGENTIAKIKHAGIARISSISIISAQRSCSC